MVSKIHAVIVWLCLLCLMGEPAGALILIEYGLTSDRHDGKLTIVIYPWGRLVGLFEASDLVGGIAVGPSVTHCTGLWCPEVHSPRTGYGGIGVACGK